MNILVDFWSLIAIPVALLIFCLPNYLSPLRKIIRSLGGKMRGNVGIFPLEGREVFVYYYSGGRQYYRYMSQRSTPFIKMYTKGVFGGNLHIRFENLLDKFFKWIGLNRELQISHKKTDRNLYFECDDQEFLNHLFLNPDVKSKIFEILSNYSDIKITRKKCLFKKIFEYHPDLTKKGILDSAKALLDFSNSIPVSAGNSPEVKIFKTKKIILYLLGGMTLVSGIMAWTFSASFPLRDPADIVEVSFHYSVPLILGGAGLAFYFIRGFSTSSKVLMCFLMPFVIGALLLGGFGAVVYNCIHDRSPVERFEQVVLDKYISKNGDTDHYNVVVRSWRPDSASWPFTVSSGEYSQTVPGSTRYAISTKAGKLGFEWVVRKDLVPVQ